ncbi:hypothetical protein OUZ56_025254 [Daphnia magna]|uniref:Uncharacterized protein n=1 Tax=Daphnia magna TaxID=35525 RepID=A0ABQ9ZJA7_9CRUS|nr:hypothetical protein OUZ56_025254 [Daphnia magna]
MYVKTVDRTANDENITVALRADLIESASLMASSHADATKTHHNDSEMVHQLRIYGLVVEPLNDFHKDERNCPDATSKLPRYCLFALFVLREIAELLAIA